MSDADGPSSGPRTRRARRSRRRTPAARSHRARSRRRSRSRPTPSNTTSRSPSRRRPMRPRHYATRSPRCSVPTTTSPCGRVGTPTRSSASVPTTRPWRSARCCAGASPKAWRPRVLVASARSIAQILSPEPTGGATDRRGAAANSTATSSSRRSRDSAIAARASSSTAPSSPCAAASSTSGPPQGHEPIRLDFFGDEVERLTSFDIANQRSLHDLDEAVVAPAREWLLSEDARRRAERMIDAMPWGRSTFDRLATGQLFDGMEGWMPLFVDEPRTLLDEVDGATVLVVEPDRVRASTGRPARRGARTDRRRRRDVAGEVGDSAAAPRVVRGARGAHRRRARRVARRRRGLDQPHVAADRPGRRRAHRRARARVVDEASRRRAHVERRGGRAHGRSAARRGTGGLDRRDQGARRAPQRAREFAGVGLQRRRPRDRGVERE